MDKVDLKRIFVAEYITSMISRVCKKVKSLLHDNMDCDNYRLEPDSEFLSILSGLTLDNL